MKPSIARAAGAIGINVNNRCTGEPQYTSNVCSKGNIDTVVTQQNHNVVRSRCKNSKML